MSSTQNPPSPGTSIDPSKLLIKPTTLEAEDLKEAARCWFKFGFQVIPSLPGEKFSYLKWDQWLDDLSIGKITNHWCHNPEHELGFIVSNDYLVLDADTPEAIEALKSIEVQYGIDPNLVVKTKRGQHHYFRRAESTIAKSDSHSTDKHPERIDVKTGRAFVSLPPSTGKTLLVNKTGKGSELVEVGQDFIDAIALHNGRPAPRSPSKQSSPPLSSLPLDDNYLKLRDLLQHIDPDDGYEDWLNVLMAVFHETKGSEEGLALADEWSSRGEKYRGSQEIQSKWQSFRDDVEKPITINTLAKMVNDTGVDAMDIIEPFETCDTEVTQDSEVVLTKDANPLDKFSLTGQSQELKTKMQEEVSILTNLALSEQMTIFYAAPNTGKTLLTLSLLLEGIQQRKMDPTRTYYLNMDDTGKGLFEKLQIAEEYGFHMLSEGYNDFKASDFLAIVKSLADNDRAQGVIIILDTLKKFVDLMHKRQSSDFANILRGFVLKGGTVIALAHTNKQKSDSGKSIYSGTSDFVDDSDCVYILETFTEKDGNKVIEFQNTKRRGNVVERAAYSYSNAPEDTYLERLLSVQPVETDKLESLKIAEEIKSDSEVIDAVSACIIEGINSKMEMAKATAERAKTSRRAVLKVIEKYTGDNPEQHRWSVSKGAHGKHTYTLLNRNTEMSAESQQDE